MADPHAEPPHVRTDLSDRPERQLALERFPTALRDLMEERHLSYRQLAYKTQLSPGYLNHLTKGTRPVPADAVIRTIATALRVEPGFFLEYRRRQVVALLERSIQLIDALYAILLRGAPGLRADEEPSSRIPTAAAAAVRSRPPRSGERE